MNSFRKIWGISFEVFAEKTDRLTERLWHFKTDECIAAGAKTFSVLEIIFFYILKYQLDYK